VLDLTQAQCQVHIPIKLALTYYAKRWTNKSRQLNSIHNRWIQK